MAPLSTRKGKPMTNAKSNHKAARALLLKYLDLHPGEQVENDLDPLEMGLVGDTRHREGGDSYHLGRDQIRATGHRYSVDESPRDRAGLDEHSSALDVGFFKATTSRGTFDLYAYNRWLIDLCEASDPDTRDIREVIYSPDGRVVRRWDRLGRRSTGDSSHLFHTHTSEFRDADGHRMICLATRWLQHIGLIPDEHEEDFPVEQKTFDALMTAWAESPAGSRSLARAVFGYDPGRNDKGQTGPAVPDPGAPAFNAKDPKTYGPGVGTIGLGTAVAAILDKAGKLQGAVTDQGRLLAALAATDAVDEQALAKALAPLIVAGLPAGTAPVTPAALEAALRNLFADLGKV